MCIRDSFKAELAVADIDRGYYRDHALTLARHPSETDERMMVRLLAYALHADDALAFGRGLSADAAIRTCLTPVSYTHLDVYKRQVKSSRTPSSGKAGWNSRNVSASR